MNPVAPSKMLPCVNPKVSPPASQRPHSNTLGRAQSGTNNALLDIPHKTIRKITCLGSGFVGGPTSAVTAFKSNVEVTVVDINPDRIAAWNSNSLPIYEPGLHEIVQAARDGVQLEDDSRAAIANKMNPEGMTCSSKISNGKRFLRKPNLFFSTDVESAIRNADLIFVCVNTPTKTNGVGKGAAADIGYVEAATRNIAKVALESKIVVEKSTVPCRTAQSIREILSANALPGVRFDVLSNPEFLAEGTAVRDLLCPDRIIIGSMTTPEGLRAAASLAEVYAQWVPSERVITMNLWSSELSKLAANALLAQRISSVNALSAICEATGADVDEVSHACGLDSRIGPHMLKAGPGFGGSCFQKDIFNIVYLSESLHLYEVADYWRSIITMNAYQKRRFTQRIVSCLFNTLAGKKIAVLGFAFKKDTSDTRESPAITLVSNFVAERADVAIYDPQVKADQIWKELVEDGGNLANLTQYVTVCKTAYNACAGADAVVILTEWDEFSNKAKPSAVELPSLTSKPSLTSSSNALAVESTVGLAERFGLISPPVSPRKLHSEVVYSASASFAKRRLQSMESIVAESSADDDRLDWARIANGMRKPMFVFDGRNILDADKLESLGFRVEAIGHASAPRAFYD